MRDCSKDKMRILLVSAIPPPAGGIATWTLKYLQYCEERNIVVNLVNTALNGSRGKKINNKRNVHDEIKRTFRILKDMVTCLSSGINVVHINTSCSQFGVIRDYMCAKKAYKKNIPFILHCHCNIEDQVSGKIRISFLKKTMDMSKRILVLNEKSKAYANSITKNEIEIVPNFIEESMLEINHVINKQVSNVVFVGHVQPSKGCREIIEVARRLPHISFTLVGPVHEEISKIQMPSNVVLTGAKEHSVINEYLKKADVYLFPSYTEGFSLSLMEAMACGLPVIATDVGANKDMIDEDMGGFIIPTKDVDSIIKALSDIKSVCVRKKMSMWNINKVKKTYMLNDVMGRICSFYKDVM